MARPKKIEEETIEETKSVEQPVESGPAVKSEKEKLMELYGEMKARGIRSISDIENLIARQ